VADNSQPESPPLTSLQLTIRVSAGRHSAGYTSSISNYSTAAKGPETTRPATKATIPEIERALAGYARLVEVLSASRTPDFPDPHVTMAQMRVSMLLSAVGEARMSDLAHSLGSSPSTLSSLVDRLVEAGLAVRRDDPRDRRNVLVSLAPAGAQMLDQFNELGADALRSLLEQLDDQEIAHVNQTIELLVAAARRLSAQQRSSEEPTP